MEGRSGQIFFGFLIGGLGGFLTCLFFGGHVEDALMPGLFCGLFLGGCGAVFSKRVFDILVAFFKL